MSALGDLSVLANKTDLPTGLADLLAALLAKQPTDRPADAASVLRHLDQVRRTSNVDALIAMEESDTVEFKSSLHHPYGPLPEDLAQKIKAGLLDKAQVAREARKQLNHAVAKTLAAFLNSVEPC